MKRGGEHAWLAGRNRCGLQASEVRLLEDSPLLMDGRRRKSDGADGADQMNARELVRLAGREDRPILRMTSVHDKPGKEKDLRAELIDDEEFNNLSAVLHVMEGARVLLTRNEWVEAGLMNGAIGTVRGFVWPEGGDPNARTSDGAVDTGKQPLCVVVEFDDVNLGEEPVHRSDGVVEVDSEGRPVMRPRTFFPDEAVQARLGVDERGRPRANRCVPIFRGSATAESDDKVKRYQFPLTLAWALTHWKAQGMTLARARVAMSAKTAAMAGYRFRSCDEGAASPGLGVLGRFAGVRRVPEAEGEGELSGAATLRVAA